MEVEIEAKAGLEAMTGAKPAAEVTINEETDIMALGTVKIRAVVTDTVTHDI